jgi:hypothetical protein
MQCLQSLYSLQELAVQKEKDQNAEGHTFSPFFGFFGPPAEHLLLAAHQPH